MMHNTLFLNRMIVYNLNGEKAYDEHFHKGVNIIRGDNSSGKSTITHFIFFILGGAFNDWVKEAKRCSHVIAEVEMNEAIITLRRNIVINDYGRANDKEGIYFFWGSLEQSQKSPEDWKKFNFNTTPERKSFSNVIFENLDIPIVKGDNNITIHQLLRLIYVDQESPTSSLFLYEQFDTSITRETVSDLLLGVYNQELYDLKQRKLIVSKDLEETIKEIRVIKKFTSNQQDLIPDLLLIKIQKKEEELSRIEDEIVLLVEEKKKVRYTQKSKLEFEELNNDAINQRRKVKDLSSKIRTFEFEIGDTEFFIQALKNKLVALQRSISTRNFLGEFPLENCPECLSKLDLIDDPSVCKLCKKEIDTSYGITQARKIEQEISFQVKESTKLSKIKKRELINLKATFDSEQLNLHQIQTRVNQSLSDVKSFRDERIDKLYVDKGFIEGEIIQFRTLLENAEIYQSLLSKQSKLERNLKNTNLQIIALTEEQDKLKGDINNAIEKKGVYLLNNDFKRQDEFFEAKEFHIDYRNNLAFIADKEARYSASSSFYLKNSARFSIFLASLKIHKMRYPRFIFCDNMEDKGIEKERAQNFQRILIEEIKNYPKKSFQMIYTTSFIPEELNIDEYSVGEYYTETNRSLKNV